MTADCHWKGVTLATTFFSLNFQQCTYASSHKLNPCIVQLQSKSDELAEQFTFHTTGRPISKYKLEYVIGGKKAAFLLSAWVFSCTD